MGNQSLSVNGVKREAKGLLTNNWSRALSALCISLLALVLFLLVNNFVLSLVNFANGSSANNQPHTFLEIYKYFSADNMRGNLILSGVLAAFYFLIVSPLRLGVINWYQSLAICGNLQVGQIFYFYRTNELFKEALVFELARLVRHAAALAITLCPAAVCFGMAIGAGKSSQEKMLTLLVAGAALLIVGLIVYAYVALRWFAAKYLYVSGRNYGVGECFRSSQRYMKKHIGRIMLLFISCIPMWLSCIFVLPALYVIPYYNAIMASAAQDIIDENISDINA